MKDEDITAFRAMPAGPSTAAPPRSWWPWVLLGLVACFVLLLAVAGAALASLADLAGSNVSISVDDETISLGSLHAGHGVAAIAALVWWALRRRPAAPTASSSA